MPFPRNPKDNSLDFSSYELLAKHEKTQALQELKKNGSPEEHAQIKEYLIEQQKKMDKQADDLNKRLADEEAVMLNLEKDKAIIIERMGKDIRLGAQVEIKNKDNGCVIF